MTLQEQKYVLKSVCYALFVPLHMLNTWGIGPIKLFYIPVFIMAMFSFWNIHLIYKDNLIVKWLIWFIGLSALPFFVSGLSIIKGFCTFLIVIVSTLPLIRMRKDLFLKLTPAFLLVSMFLVKQYAIFRPDILLMRFQGLYNDANYLVMSVLVGSFICILAFKRSNLINRIIIAGVLAMGTNFLLLSQSRGGLLSFVIMLAMGILELYKTKKVLATSLLILMFLGSGSYIAMNQERIDVFSNRIEGMSNETSTQTRLWQAKEAWHGAEEHPEIVIIGVGVGKTSEVVYPYNKRPDDILSMVYRQSHIIHMTPISIWFENGSLAFFAYIVLNILLFINLLRSHNLFLLGFFSAITLQSCTINTIDYLPYWMGVALCINARSLICRKNYLTQHYFDEDSPHHLGLS